MDVDSARNYLGLRLLDLASAERSGDTWLIKRAQEAVTRAEKVLVEVTLRDEGGWRP